MQFHTADCTHYSIFADENQFIEMPAINIRIATMWTWVY